MCLSVFCVFRSALGRNSLRTYALLGLFLSSSPFLSSSTSLSSFPCVSSSPSLFFLSYPLLVSFPLILSCSLLPAGESVVVKLAMSLGFLIS